ncbi:transcriptional regulator [Tengunoibacter tsumagoiensis]|uniref:Transcriptional regulator n=1 Tax=Tengunoibacter tsumagoiensis TaxID=2014871 RepID=A0A401ZW17_9CHLR|nr:transcriptional regulator [Tengunoibacter tsumagoiensis]
MLEMDYTLEGSVYNRIAAIRAERGLERSTVADAVGISPQQLGYIEHKRIVPSLELALRLSAYLMVPMEQLFGLQPFPSPEHERTFKLL